MVIVISRKWTVFIADLPEFISDKVKGRVLHISQETGTNLSEKQVGNIIQYFQSTVYMNTVIFFLKDSISTIL